MVLSKRLIFLIGVSTSLLLIPLIAMQFSNDVDWKFNDFLIAAALFYGLSLVIEAVLQNFRRKHLRIALICAALLIFLLLWIEMAVGLFGSPISGS